jgi:hypothetical protein
MMDNRIGKRKLEELAERLSQRDQDILTSLADYRYLTSDQIRRLHFARHATELAALRSVNRTLAKLKEYDLIFCLPRRIGGVRSGSGAYIWAVNNTGLRIVSDDSQAIRKRLNEPSTTFLTHTLAVAETAVRLKEMERTNKIGLLECSPEPLCWRAYEDERGKAISLKSDLFSVTTDGEYEDHWFIEVDLATERPVRVVEKCRQYLAYMKTNLEQKRYGVFPLVVWIVPEEKRQDSILSHLTAELGKSAGIFKVLTLAEFEELLQNGTGF